MNATTIADTVTAAAEDLEAVAVDYLLKPVEARRLQQSIERVKHRLTTGSTWA